MAAVVIVHGMGYQFRHRRRSRVDWYRALADGMDNCHLPVPNRSEIEAVHYGDCFRLVSVKAPGGDIVDDSDAELAGIPPIELDQLSSFEADFIAMLAGNTAEDRPSEESTKGGIYLPSFVQDQLRRIDADPFLPDLPRRAVLWMVRQVDRYLGDERIRSCIQERVERAVAADSRVLIGHSLGSVVAYEVLCAHPEWRIDTLVTLGSPLGLWTVGERLTPAVSGRRGIRPNVRRWVNVAAPADPVALVKQLSPIFGNVEDEGINNGRWRAHEIGMYINSPPVAEAIDDAIK